MLFPQIRKGYKLTWLEKCAVALVKVGPMPKHVAIILDGNRRYARRMNLEGVTMGHKIGSTKVDELIDILLALGIEELTVFAFSVENFKRAKEEVDGIMKLLEERSRITDEKLAKLKEVGVSIEAVGDLNSTPSRKLKETLERGMWLSKEHTKLRVKVAFIYTGRNEIVSGVNQVMSGLASRQIGINEVTGEVLQGTFTLHPSSPVDIMIRTSGETRMSDFLMWDCSEAYLEFVGETWPEFTSWGLIAAVFRYQNQVLWKGLKKPASNSETGNNSPFVEAVRKQRWNEIESRTTRVIK